MREVALNHRVSEFIPRYYQVYMVLQQRIREGEWSRDTLMPTEEEFTQKFGVSRVTIRKALNMLQAEKLIIREQGRGTFAAPPAAPAAPCQFQRAAREHRRFRAAHAGQGAGVRNGEAAG
jgi:DNA-binding GntR family transcriptional regulator